MKQKMVTMQISRPVRHRTSGISTVEVALTAYISARDGPKEFQQMEDELLRLMSELSTKERQHK